MAIRIILAIRSPRAFRQVGFVVPYCRQSTDMGPGIASTHSDSEPLIFGMDSTPRDLTPSERLRKGFEGRIFGSTRQRVIQDDTRVRLMSTPLGGDESLSLVDVSSRVDGRSSYNNFLAPQRSFPDLTYPVGTDGIPNQFRNIRNHLPGDLVPSAANQGLGSPASPARRLPTGNRVLMPSGSTLSLQSTRGHNEYEILSSTFAARAPLFQPSAPISIPSTREFEASMSFSHRFGYFRAGNNLEMANTPYERDVAIANRRMFTNTEYHTRRHARVFDGVAIPPVRAQRQPVNFQEPTEALNVRATITLNRPPTPYPDELQDSITGGNVPSRVYRNLRQLFGSRAAR